MKTTANSCLRIDWTDARKAVGGHHELRISVDFIYQFAKQQNVWMENKYDIHSSKVCVEGGCNVRLYTVYTSEKETFVTKIRTLLEGIVQPTKEN